MKSCLLFIIIIALAGALVIAMARLAAVEKEREEEKLTAEAKPVEKTPRQAEEVHVLLHL